MNFIPVKTFDSYITANIWLARLQDAGIECYLKDEYTVTIDPVLSNAVGGIKLCIEESHLHDGLQLVAAFENENRQKQECPKCGSLNVQYVTKPGATNWMSAIVFWILGSYAIGAEQVYHCYNCGNEFDEVKNDTLNIAG